MKTWMNALRGSVQPLWGMRGLQLLAVLAIGLAVWQGLLPAETGLGLAFAGETAIEGLRARLLELQNIAEGIQAKADGEKRDLTADEQKELDAVMNEFDQVEGDIKRRERIQNQATRISEPGPRQTAPAAREAAPAGPPAPVAAAPRQVVDNGLRNTMLSTHDQRQRFGFQNMGEFANSVRAAVLGRGMDPRLQNAALTTYGNEGTGADGGFTVPPEWRSEIMRLIEADEDLLSLCDRQTVSGNNITFPVDESTAWQSSGGIQAYWDGEADTINQSKPQLKDLNIKLHRLTALVPVTEELLEDSTAMSGYITGKAGEKIAFKLTDAIINGTGAGMPLGIMNAPAKVAVAKETSQTAATVHGANVAKMMARMMSRSFQRARWVINQDVLPQIMQLGFVVNTPSGTAAGAGALYMPPAGLANQSAYGSLLGRPLVVSEACQTLGTEGDIILGDFTKYLAAVKGALKTDVSIHLWFDQNTTAFRFVLRMNGQPWLSAPVARKNGANTLSHFVTLSTRA